jgi:hypothetical protein
MTVKELRHLLTGFRKIVPRGEAELRRIQIDLGSRMRFMVSDGNSVLTYAMNASSSTPGSYLFSLDQLADFVKGLSARQEVVIERHEQRLSFLTESRSLHAQAMKSESSFPPVPRLGGKIHSVASQDREAILRALSCASKDDTRYVLKGVLIEDGRAVGTDGRTLYHERLHELPANSSFILPASPLIKWPGYGMEWQVRRSAGRKSPVRIELRSGPWTFHTPAIEGNFPNWRQVLPDERKLPCRLQLGEEDIATLRTLTGNSIALRARDGFVSFLHLSDDGKQWHQHRATGSIVKGPDACIVLAREFLNRALDAGLREVCIGAEHDPCLFKGQGDMIVMPLRISGPPLPGDKPKPHKPIETRPAQKPTSKSMKSNPTPPQPTPLEIVQESLRTLKGQLRESIGHVDTALRQLRDAQADQRATQKDIKTIRGTLQSLKKVGFPN